MSRWKSLISLTCAYFIRAVLRVLDLCQAGLSLLVVLRCDPVLPVEIDQDDLCLAVVEDPVFEVHPVSTHPILQQVRSTTHCRILLTQLSTSTEAQKTAAYRSDMIIHLLIY